MRLFLLLLLAVLAKSNLAEPEPYAARVFGRQTPDETSNPFYKKDQNLYAKSDASSGRLFLRKFLFNKFFDQNKSPSIIPIIIAGTGGDATTVIDTPTGSDVLTTPTIVTTITDPSPIISETDDTSTPIVANPPALPVTPVDPADPVDPVNPADPTDPTDPVDPTSPTRRFQLYDLNEEDIPLNDGHNANEYVVTGQKIKNSFSAQGNRVPTRLNLRLRGGQRDRAVTLSLPAKYRGYFTNGQRVVLQGKRPVRPGKRRVIRRRKNRRRVNRNKKNKRQPFITV